MNASCKTPLAVVQDANDDPLRAAAKALADELSIPVLDDVDRRRMEYEFLLVVRSDGVELHETGRARSRPLRVDFIRGRMGRRLRTVRAEGQPIARAVGIRGERRAILDATAGFGRDAFLLASLGCNVIAVERSPVIGALLRDGLARAASPGDARTSAAATRVTLIIADARSVLKELAVSDAPDVVYLDPMYPLRRSSALAKKEMRICRRLVGEDADAVELLDVARGIARDRIVVKRQRYAPPLGAGPDFEYVGRAVRYDVYRPTPGISKMLHAGRRARTKA